MKKEHNSSQPQGLLLKDRVLHVEIRRNAQEIIYVRYYDHVLFKNANPKFFKPTIREAVGFLNFENDLFIRLIIDIPYKKIPYEKANQTSGLVILKKNIIERKEL